MLYEDEDEEDLSYSNLQNLLARHSALFALRSKTQTQTFADHHSEEQASMRWKGTRQTSGVYNELKGSWDRLGHSEGGGSEEEGGRKGGKRKGQGPTKNTREEAILISAISDDFQPEMCVDMVKGKTRGGVGTSLLDCSERYAASQDTGREDSADVPLGILCLLEAAALLQ